MKWYKLAEAQGAPDSNEQKVIEKQDAAKPIEQATSEKLDRQRQNPGNYMTQLTGPLLKGVFPGNPEEKALFEQNKNKPAAINMMHLLDKAFQTRQEGGGGLSGNQAQNLFKKVDVPPASSFKQPRPPLQPGQKPPLNRMPNPTQKVPAKRPPVSAQKIDEIEKKISGPGESLNLLGTDDVTISGDFQPVINVKGVGAVNIPITITDIVNKIKTTLADQHALVQDPSLHDYHHAFQRITNVNVGSFGPGEAGHAESKSPHTININWEGMRKNMEDAVNAQIDSFSQQYGTPPEITEDVIQRIKVKVAEMMWNEAAKTVAHESRHARDFQDVLRRMMMTGQGSLSEASEGRAESEEGLVSNIKPPTISWSRKLRTIWAKK